MQHLIMRSKIEQIKLKMAAQIEMQAIKQGTEIEMWIEKEIKMEMTEQEAKIVPQAYE